ncbi:hypothetical protein F4821DRAFT_126064 [Hypoxylon rubiginosum]|uniref:Uncharacterized protein n=1 Tax=Hypoxylon rubiginosum TaxID=110542 RepID=A0ACC0D1E9_9PEZI|nr:hypothetical protein F4821DRAFT_126064 [Hypoxylon rubiginosum]
MDNSVNFAAAFGSPSTMRRSRIPLSNRSNSNPPHYVPIRTKWDRRDSSKGQPSSHDSIYDAPWVSDESPTSKSPSPYQVPTIPARTTTTPTSTTTAARPVTPPPTRPVPDPNAESPLSRLEAETPFLYGHGTELAPIIEQRSISTLRTGNPSTSDISSLLKHKASGTGSSSNANVNGNTNTNGSTLQPPRPLRRQNSFSLDDLSHHHHQHSHHKGESSSISAGKRRETSSEPDPVVISNSFNNADALSSGSSNRSDTGSGMLGVPRLRNSAAKRHSPPVVETVDMMYPQKPTYPPHQSPSAPAGFAEWLTTRAAAADTYPYPNPATAQRPGSGSGSGAGAGSRETPPQFQGIRSGHGNLGVHPYMRPLATATHPGSMAAVEDGAPTTQSQSQGCDEAGGEQSSSVRVQESDTLVAPAQQSQTVYEPQRYPWTCSACGRPADQRWSLLATVTGQGRGARRGGDWCSRCAWRKMVYLACCCEQPGS